MKNSVTSTNSVAEELLSKYLGRIALVVVLVGVAIVRLRFGWASVPMWLAFCALSGAAFLFWEALRSALDPAAPGDGDDDPEVRLRLQSELEERKKAALRAIKDLQFEFEIGRISEQDHKELSDRYRQEARQVMAELDFALGTHLKEAEDEFDRIAAEESGEKPAETATDQAVKAEAKAEEKTEEASDFRECSKCKTRNDIDAKFCKNCATALSAEEKSL